MSPLDRCWLFLATGLGVGWSPYAPGTIGTLWGLPLAWGMAELALSPWGWGGACVVLFLLGVPLCTKAASLLQTEDPGAVVIDEIAAIPIVFLFAPVTPWTLLSGFLLFRLFDVWKPWPISRFEHLPRGWGVMADDTIAALMAAGVLRSGIELFA